MAITMWDHLIPGLTVLRKLRGIPRMDMTYFTFHRQLESEHEKAMEHAIAAVEGTGSAFRTQYVGNGEERFSTSE